MVNSVDENVENIEMNNVNPQALGNGENSQNETSSGNGYLFRKKLCGLAQSKCTDICLKVR